jgi:hypothetical protein
VIFLKQKTRQKASFLCIRYLSDRPVFFLDENVDKVDEAHEGNENKNDADYDSECVLCINSFNDTVDVNCDFKENSEKNFNDPREIVKKFDKIFHCESLQKLFLLGVSPIHVILYNISRKKSTIFLFFLEYFHQKLHFCIFI